MDIIECPAPGESEAGPQFPPHEAGVLSVFARVIGCPLQVNSPHMPVLLLLLYRQTDTELRPGRETVRRSLHFGTPANTHVRSRHTQPYHVVGALLGAVGPVHSLRRLTEQAILPSAQEIVPIVAKLNTAAAGPAFKDDVALCCIARWLD